MRGRSVQLKLQPYILALLETTAFSIEPAKARSTPKMGYVPFLGYRVAVHNVFVGAGAGVVEAISHLVPQEKPNLAVGAKGEAKRKPPFLGCPCTEGFAFFFRICPPVG